MESTTQDPYRNLAIEELLFDQMSKEHETVLLYLWVNEPSVIIGRNQNPFIECNLDLMARDGVHLVRRKTGGGAVFHDLGNLNFTFISSEKIADRAKWNTIICNAVHEFGIIAKESGRNDLIDGNKKFSGTAFRRGEGLFLHHGTIMVDVDIGCVKQYLTPQKSKLQRHGIQSVMQRVCNLSELNRDITIENIKSEIKRQACSSYQLYSIENKEVCECLDYERLKRLSDEYASFEFINAGYTSDDVSSDKME